MNIPDIVQILGVIVALIVGFWNMKNTSSLTVPQNMLNLNTAIGLANKRALEAETVTDNLREELHQFKKDSAVIVETLERQIDLLTSAMACRYRIVFDIIGELGKEVRISNAEIYPMEERRVEDKPVEKERRTQGG
jgi:hypothetical protein